MSDSDTTPSTVWQHGGFTKLYTAHVASLLGAAMGTVAIALLAEELRPGKGPKVLAVTLVIRIAIFVFLSPLAGQLSDRLGRRLQMIAADLLRAAVMGAMFFATEVWQLYVLAFLMHLGSAFFTPVYKAVIPGVVGEKLYPRALAYGTMAYNLSDIVGMTLGALVIAGVGFRGGFAINCGTFLASAALISMVNLRSDRARLDSGEKGHADLLFGIRKMLLVPALRRSLMLSLQVSILGGLAIVSTAGYVINELGMGGKFYPLAMAAMGVGSMLAALHFSNCANCGRRRWSWLVLPVFFAVLVSVALFQTYPVLLFAWFVSGAGQGVFGIVSNNMLADNTIEAERPHVYAAQFALSHAGWGITYPVCGWVTADYGFAAAAWVCVGMLALTLLPLVFSARAARVSASGSRRPAR